MRAILALSGLVALTIACSGGTTPTGPTLPPLPTGGAGVTTLRGSVRATVDGTPWESAFASAAVGAFTGLPALLTVSAVSSSAGFSVSVTGPAAVGTYDAGAPSATSVSFSVIEGFASFWSVNPFATGSSGTLTVTAATGTRVAGSFSFTAVARTQGLTPATRTVTNGTFDLSQ